MLAGIVIQNINKDTKIRDGICFKTPEQHYFGRPNVSILNFRQTSHITSDEYTYFNTIKE